MANSIVSHSITNNSNANSTTFTQSVSAQYGDMLIVILSWRNGQSVNSVTWNGLTLTQYGQTLSILLNSSAAVFRVRVTTLPATANLTVTFNAATFCNVNPYVIRATSGMLDVGGMQTEQFAILGAFVAPNLSVAVPAGAIPISAIVGSGLSALGINVTSSTWTIAGQFAPQDNIQNSNLATNILASASSSSSGTTVTSNWTRTGGLLPQWSHFLFYVQSVASTATLDNINGNNQIAYGQVTCSLATTGLGTITSLTIGGVEMTNIVAPLGDGPFDFTALVAGQAYPDIGTYTAVTGDGINSASRSVNIVAAAGTSTQLIQAPVRSSNTSLKAAIPNLGTNDRVHFTTSPGRSISSDGTLVGWAPGIYTIGVWQSGIFRYYSVEINDNGTIGKFGASLDGKSLNGGSLFGASLKGKHL